MEDKSQWNTEVRMTRRHQGLRDESQPASGPRSKKPRWQAGRGGPVIRPLRTIPSQRGLAAR
jgi:hypothetical protein